MGKNMREKDGHKMGNNQVEEGIAVEKESDVLDVSTENMNDVSKSSNRDDDKNKGKDDNNEKKKDRTKKRKSEFDTDENESRKAQKKHKKGKDAVGEIKKISMETCLSGKENTEQESSEAMYLENNFDSEAKRVRKDKHKNKNRDGIDAVATVTETLEHSKMQEPIETQKICSTEDINKFVQGTEGEYEKRKKKKKQKLEKVSGNVAGHIAVMSSINDGNDKHKNKNRDGIDAAATVTETLEHSKMQEPIEAQKICSTEDINKFVQGKEGEYEKRKKKKKKQKLEIGGHIAVMSSITDGNDTDKEDSAGNKVECRKLGGDVGDAEDGNRGRKKKSKSVKNDSEGKHHKGDARTRKSVDSTNQSENATPKERSKKVSFCDHVEVFPPVDVIDEVNKDGKEGLVYGRRYSKEEDEILMNAVANYIDSHELGDEGVNMVLNCRLYPEVKNCWKEIQAGIPWRPLGSVYHRAHVLFERDEKRPWTPEEYEVIHKFVEKHGTNWRLLGDTLGKYRHHVKDTWRRIKLTNTSKGHWSQEEYQNLFDLVNLDLCMKASEEKKSKHGMLRDNICWTAISDKMQTRAFANCCKKWYDSLASPMVAEGIWADVDDYRMLNALCSLDACCMEDVDWDNLIEHRSGDICRKRWNQMVQHIGPHRDKSFAEQVEILANRYRPDMLDAREAYDSKCPVDQP
ncbi:RNA polymerase I termination factor [Durio zibethinus]|uniref:RNA polymerase I termination factor n=1 Tax=Durio zibethinus TaxID=66656 RepID=A0A6P5XQ56_DURZI|nr:RNA polymerase I termination factor [Durio zibethinus]XP_022730308.1 RNA polymerase I termination factor [Durio zibethinus]